MAAKKEPVFDHLPTTPMKGIVCRNCGCAHFYVVWIRHRENYTIRRRECRHCGKKILTREYQT